MNSVRPVISGTAQVGQWLSVSNGTWSPTPTSYAYAWHRCNSAGTSCSLSPSSSNSSSYLVGSGDVGYTIVAQVAPNGLWGSSVNSAPSAVVSRSAPSGTPVNSVRPAISGTAQVGQWLSVSNGTWSPTPTSYAYAWHRCNSSGTSCSLSPSSSSSSSYLVGSGDFGYTIVAQVAPNGLWGSSVNSAPSAVVVGSAPSGSPVNSVRPVISGRLRLGSGCRSRTGRGRRRPRATPMRGIAVTRRGRAARRARPRPSSSSYLVGSGDFGYTIVAQVAPNGLWGSSATSLPTAVVTGTSSGTPVNTVRPVISGLLRWGSGCRSRTGRGRRRLELHLRVASLQLGRDELLAEPVLDQQLELSGRLRRRWVHDGCPGCPERRLGLVGD